MDFVEQARSEGIQHFCVGLALIDNGEVLIVRRVANDFLGSYWELPGGGAEIGETLENCLSREIEEELGLILDEDYTVEGTLQPFDFTSKSGKLVRQWNVRAHLKVERTKVRLNPAEHDSFLWVNPRNAMSATLSPEIQAVLAEI